MSRNIIKISHHIYLIVISLIIFVLTLPAAQANSSIGFIEIIGLLTAIIYIPICLLEVILFVIILKIFKYQISTRFIFLIIYISNLISTIFGIFLNSYNFGYYFEPYTYPFENILFIGILYFITVIIEFCVILLFLKYISSIKIKKQNFFALLTSIVINFISYFILICIF